MKKLFTLFITVLIFTSVFAQAPQKMSYQAVIRDGSNALVTSTAVGMQISILQGSANGTSVYVETQTPASNANGLVSLEVGAGTVVSGTFAAINWANGPYFIKTETDPAGGTNYTITGTSQLSSVPYAMYAASSGSSIPGPQGPQGLLSNGTTAGNTPYWNGTAWVLNNSNLHNNGAGVGVGTNTPNTSAKLEVASTTQGFLPPRMTTVERDAIASPAPGLTIYNTSVNCLQWWNGTIWFDGCGNNSIVGSITALNCGSATNNGTLTSGTAASGVNSVVPYIGGNGGSHNGQTVTSTGVIGLTATLSAGTFANGAGSLTYTITGTPSASGTASFALSIGGQSCALTRTVGLTAGSITALNCGSATNNGTLYSGTAASGVSSSVSYTGGNGGTYSSQNITSTGVTGLTATLIAGTFAIGAGSLTYTITGTPSSSGTANFALNIGGQTCTLTFLVSAAQPSVFCASGPTVIVDVTNPATGRIWMDRNLGATQVATSSTDTNSYGDLYQWGRRSDGHQCRTSPTTSTLSSIDQPAHGSFIVAPNSPYDWRSPQNNNLWQGVNGINNPCPSGYRFPTNQS